jgi:hypothetical protein
MLKFVHWLLKHTVQCVCGFVLQQTTCFCWNLNGSDWMDLYSYDMNDKEIWRKFCFQMSNFQLYTDHAEEP